MALLLVLLAIPGLASTLHGRWHVVAESVDRESPLALTSHRRELVAPAWQIEAVLECGTGPATLVHCAVVDCALRVATFDHWQKESDRRLVQELLNRTRRQLAEDHLLVTSHPDGSVELASEPTGLAVTLLGDAIAAFHLTGPPDGWRAGARWRTTREPLLHVRQPQLTEPRGPASHIVSEQGKDWIVETAGTSHKIVLVPLRSRFAYRSERWRRSGNLAGRVKARFDVPAFEGLWIWFALPRYQGRLTLQARARLERDTDIVEILERTWSVVGTGATPLYRGGRLRRLVTDRSVDLGGTHQVSDPDASRARVEPWLSVLGGNP